MTLPGIVKGFALSLSSTTRVAVTVEAMPAVPVPVTGMTVSRTGSRRSS